MQDNNANGQHRQSAGDITDAAALTHLESFRAEEIAELRAQVEAWRKQCDTLTHQVICCGVAASHPDATLTTRGAYAGKWNSAQAEEVRKLRADRDRLHLSLKAALSHWREFGPEHGFDECIEAAGLAL